MTLDLMYHFSIQGKCLSNLCCFAFCRHLEHIVLVHYREVNEVIYVFHKDEMQVVVIDSKW